MFTSTAVCPAAICAPPMPVADAVVNDQRSAAAPGRMDDVIALQRIEGDLIRIDGGPGGGRSARAVADVAREL